MATAGGASASFSYPLSTQVTVGEDPSPGLHRDDRLWAGPATAVHRRCLRRHLPGRGRRDPDLHAHEHGGSNSHLDGAGREATWARPRRRRSSSTRTAPPRSTPRPLPPPAVRARPSPIQPRRAFGETSVPTGYTATIDCGQGPQPYAGGPINVTAPAVAGATLTCTITNASASTPLPPELSTVQVVKNYVGTPSATTIFVDQNGAARTTPRRSRPRAVPAPTSATRSRRRSLSARNRGRGVYGDDRLWARPAAVRRRADQRHRAGRGGRDPHLHDHEYCAPSPEPPTPEPPTPEPPTPKPPTPKPPPPPPNRPGHRQGCEPAARRCG